MKSSRRSMPIAFVGRPDEHRRETRAREPVLRAARRCAPPGACPPRGTPRSARRRTRRRPRSASRGRVGHRVQVVGPLRLLGHRAARVQVGLLVEQVGDPAELVLLADRQLERRDLVAEARTRAGRACLEVGALAVELVHEDRARQALLRRRAPTRTRSGPRRRRRPR